MDFEEFSLITVFSIIALVWILFSLGIFIIFRIKNRTESPFRKPRFWIISILSFLPAFFLGALIYISVLSYVPVRKFTAGEWIDFPENRVEIVDDLMESGYLDSLSMGEVIELLGEPLIDSEYFSSLDYDMIYHLGPERGFMRIDNEWLLIWFKDDRVEKYEIRHD